MQIQRRGLDQRPDTPEQGKSFRFQRTPKQQYSASVWTLETKRHPNCCRLSTSVRSEEPVYALSGHIQAKPTHCRRGSVRFPNFFDPNGDLYLAQDSPDTSAAPKFPPPRVTIPS